MGMSKLTYKYSANTAITRAIAVMTAIAGLTLWPETATAGAAATATQLKPVSADSSHGQGIFYLKAKHSRRCITVHGASTGNGATIDQYSCVGQANQRWRVLVIAVVSNKLSYTAYLIAENSGKCMDVQGGSTANGAKVIQWSCNSRKNQIFNVQLLADGNVLIRPFHSNKCLDVEGAATGNNVRLIQWKCNYTNNQRFTRIRA